MPSLADKYLSIPLPPVRKKKKPQPYPNRKNRRLGPSNRKSNMSLEDVEANLRALDTDGDGVLDA
jgi:hypothetical protein